MLLNNTEPKIILLFIAQIGSLINISCNRSKFSFDLQIFTK